MTTETGQSPHHVAIIMDGNGRWATRLGRPRTFGHHRGAERVREVLKTAPTLGIKVLTLFAFSTENWRRPEYEVKVLMGLFRRYAVREIDELDSAGVRVRFIGQRERLPSDLQRMMTQLEERTAENDLITLQVALSYGSRAEITGAVRRIAAEIASGERSAEAIDEELISASLDTGGVPDPDLVIRTSGEFRVSNFLLWQAAYAEFEFVDVCWPDFTAEHLTEIVSRFGKRERRYGAVASS